MCFRVQNFNLGLNFPFSSLYRDIHQVSEEYQWKELKTEALEN